MDGMINAVTSSSLSTSSVAHILHDSEVEVPVAFCSVLSRFDLKWSDFLSVWIRETPYSQHKKILFNTSNQLFKVLKFILYQH